MVDQSPSRTPMPAVIPGLEGYPGCKGGAGVYQQIISHLPKCKILYIPFLGHCAITRNIKRPYKLILNDINPDVVERWKEALLNSGFILRNEVTAEIQREQFALDLIYIFEDARGDSMIHLFCGDAISQIKHFGTFENIVIYADPPYRMTDRRKSTKIYKYESSQKLHRDLLSLSKRILAKTIISSYKNEQYERALSKWSTHSFNAMTHGGVAEETIFYNFDLNDIKLHDYRYLGQNYKDRERIRLKIARHTNKLKQLPIQERNAILEAINSNQWEPSRK